MQIAEEWAPPFQKIICINMPNRSYALRDADCRGRGSPISKKLYASTCQIGGISRKILISKH
jgi:hypothetical protein